MSKMITLTGKAMRAGKRVTNGYTYPTLADLRLSNRFAEGQFLDRRRRVKLIIQCLTELCWV